MNNVKIGIISIAFLLSGTALAVDEPNTEETGTPNVTAPITSEITIAAEPESNTTSSSDSAPITTEIALTSDTSLSPSDNNNLIPPISNNNNTTPKPAPAAATTASEPETPKFPSYQLATILRFRPQTKSNARSLNPSEAVAQGQDLTVYLRVGENKASFGSFTCVPNPNHANNMENPENIKPSMILSKMLLESKFKTQGVSVKSDIKLEGGMSKEDAIAMLKNAGIFEKEVHYVSRKKTN